MFIFKSTSLRLNLNSVKCIVFNCRVLNLDKSRDPFRLFSVSLKKKKKDFIFRDRKRREKKGQKHRLVASWTRSSQVPNLQPRHVPQWGPELVAILFPGQHPTNRAALVRAWSRLFCSVCFWDSSTLMLVVWFFLLLSNTPLHEYASLFKCSPLVHRHLAVFSFGLLWLNLHWTFSYSCLCGHLFIFLG